MYVDESGDPGLNNSPTRYFILSSMVFHELRWNMLLDDLIDFRRYLRNQKGLKLREEIHASDFINSPGDLRRIKRHNRVDILKKCIDWIAVHNDISIMTVCVDKKGKTEDIFELGWKILIQRFENTISYRNFPGPSNSDERGMFLPDNTDGEKLTKLVRRMRRYNPISNTSKYFNHGNRNIPVEHVIEDPFLKHSYNFFYIQMVDVVAYCARQLYEPNSYMKKKGGHNFYLTLLLIIILLIIAIIMVS